MTGLASLAVRPREIYESLENNKRIANPSLETRN